MRDFSAACSEAWGSPLLDMDFHDRIVFKEGQIELLKKYIDDNPRRLWLKRKFPDILSKRHRIRICGEEYEAVGNIFMLDDFDIQAVRISRSYSADELRRYKGQWLRTIDNGGVLVSPFISVAEKRVRDYAMSCNCKLILFETEGFPERYKPPGELFDYCLGGRLLMIAPREYSTRRLNLTRRTALRLNGLAQEIADGRAEIVF